MEIHIKKTVTPGFPGRRLNSSTLIPTYGRRPNPLTLQAEEARLQGNPLWRVVRGVAVVVFLPILLLEVAILWSAAA